MDRRSFLRALGIGAAALTLDPEMLLWVPGKKTIFLPSVVQQGNTFITPTWVTREVAALWTANISMLRDTSLSDASRFSQLTRMSRVAGLTL